MILILWSKHEYQNENILLELFLLGNNKGNISQLKTLYLVNKRFKVFYSENIIIIRSVMTCKS